MIVYLLSINDSPVTEHFEDINALNNYINIAVAASSEYCRIDVFRLNIPNNIPENDKYDLAVNMLMQKNKILKEQIAKGDLDVID